MQLQNYFQMQWWAPFLCAFLPNLHLFIFPPPGALVSHVRSAGNPIYTCRGHIRFPDLLALPLCPHLEASPLSSHLICGVRRWPRIGQRRIPSLLSSSFTSPAVLLFFFFFSRRSSACFRQQRQEAPVWGSWRCLRQRYLAIGLYLIPFR